MDYFSALQPVYVYIHWIPILCIEATIENDQKQIKLRKKSFESNQYRSIFRRKKKCKETVNTYISCVARAYIVILVAREKEGKTITSMYKNLAVTLETWQKKRVLQCSNAWDMSGNCPSVRVNSYFFFLHSHSTQMRIRYTTSASLSVSSLSSTVSRCTFIRLCELSTNRRWRLYFFFRFGFFLFDEISRTGWKSISCNYTCEKKMNFGRKRTK